MNNENINAEAYAADAPAFLGKHEYARLCEAIHTSQLGIFQGVFLRSLRVLHETLREIPIEGQQGMSLFDLKINELCAAFKRLSNLPELYSKESEVFRNTAVTAFTFYRVLYKGVYAAFSNHHKTKAHFDVDPNILYKRIPYSLYEYLGGQYWRIYEFYEATAGDLADLKLNADIKYFIENGCAEMIENSNAKPQQNNSESSISESIILLSSEQAKKSQMLLFDSGSAAMEQLRLEFTDWVQKQLDQDYLHLNERGVFSSTLKYGQDLFIEEGVLTQFAMLYQKDIKELKQVLKASAAGKVYTVSFQQKTLEAYRLSGLQFIVDEIHPREIKERVENGN